MLPWITLDTAKIPGGDELRLKQRGREFSIMLGANELMNSRMSGSEQALATLACERLTSGGKPRVLIGGLGMGFTLRAALRALPAGAEITVAELVPEVITWARGPMADVHGTSLDDQRVSTICTDVRDVIGEARSRFDAILLDVDNGPDGLTASRNDALYAPSGLADAKAALKPRGVLAIWSAHPDAAFACRLTSAGFAVEEKRVRASGSGGGAKHVIWLATRTS